MTNDLPARLKLTITVMSTSGWARWAAALQQILNLS